MFPIVILVDCFCSMKRSLLQPFEAGHNSRRHRFSHRPKRISRRAERDQFGFYVVPIIWLLGLLGFTGGVFSALHYLVAGAANWPAYLLAAVPLLSALLLLLFRFVRGHYNSALEEP